MEEAEQTYGFEYSHAGKRWLINISAANEHDARERLAKASRWGQCVGTLEATIPVAVPGAGLLARLLCWWRNL